MKQIKHFLTLILISVSTVIFGINYTTISNGSWENSATWENSIIPPQDITSGNNIVINHEVTISAKTFTGYVNIEINDTLIVNGIVNIPSDAIIVIDVNCQLKPSSNYLLHNIYFDNNSDNSVFLDNNPIIGGVYISFDGLDVKLPVELISFNCNTEGTETIFKWVTATELNNDYFILMQSLNGIEYNDVAIIDGYGNSNHEIQYKYSCNVDDNSYFKLKQVDFDGQFTLSNAIIVNLKQGEKELICVYSVEGRIIDSYNITPGVYIFRYSNYSEKKYILNSEHMISIIQDK